MELSWEARNNRSSPSAGPSGSNLNPPAICHGHSTHCCNPARYFGDGSGRDSYVFSAGKAKYSAPQDFKASLRAYVPMPRERPGHACSPPASPGARQANLRRRQMFERLAQPKRQPGDEQQTDVPSRPQGKARKSVTKK